MQLFTVQQTFYLGTQHLVVQILIWVSQIHRWSQGYFREANDVTDSSCYSFFCDVYVYIVSIMQVLTFSLSCSLLLSIIVMLFSHLLLFHVSIKEKYFSLLIILLAVLITFATNQCNSRHRLLQVGVRLFGIISIN